MKTLNVTRKSKLSKDLNMSVTPGKTIFMSSWANGKTSYAGVNLFVVTSAKKEQRFGRDDLLIKTKRFVVGNSLKMMSHLDITNYFLTVTQENKKPKATYFEDVTFWGSYLYTFAKPSQYNPKSFFELFNVVNKKGETLDESLLS